MLITDPKKQRIMKDVIKHLLEARVKFKTPAYFGLEVFVSDKRRRDLDGMEVTVLDCLVKAGAIPDDCWQEAQIVVKKVTVCVKGMEGFEIWVLDEDKKNEIFSLFY